LEYLRKKFKKKNLKTCLFFKISFIVLKVVGWIIKNIKIFFHKDGSDSNIRGNYKKALN